MDHSSLEKWTPILLLWLHDEVASCKIRKEIDKDVKL
jgi:hypothetical protein